MEDLKLEDICIFSRYGMYAIVVRVFRYSHLGVHSLVVRMTICSQVYIDISRFQGHSTASLASFLSFSCSSPDKPWLDLAESNCVGSLPVSVIILQKGSERCRRFEL